MCRAFGFSYIGNGFGETLKHLMSKLLMQGEPSAKNNGDLDFRTILQEFSSLPDFCFKIMIVGQWREANSLHHQNMLFLPRLSLPPRNFILVLPKIQDATNRRIGGGSNFHEIQLSLSRERQGLVGFHNPELLTACINQTNQRGTNTLVNPNGAYFLLLFWGRRTSVS